MIEQTPSRNTRNLDKSAVTGLSVLDTSPIFEDWFVQIKEQEQIMRQSPFTNDSKWRLAHNINEALHDLRGLQEEKFISYDCHTFVYAALEHCGLQIPRIVQSCGRPGYGLPDCLVEIYSSPEGKAVRAAQRAITEKFLSMAIPIDVPVSIKDYRVWFRNHEFAPDADALLEKASQPCDVVAKQVLDNFYQKQYSSWILLTRGSPPDQFHELHSVLVLGPNVDGDDLWIAQRKAIGCEIEWQLLSTALSDYVLGVTAPGTSDYLQLNLLPCSAIELL